MVRVILQGLVMGFFLLLGKSYPRQEQKFFHGDLWINILTGAGIFLLIAPVMRFVGEAMTVHLLLLPELPSIIQFVGAFLILDFCRYWLHFAHHRVPFLWVFHRVHHSSEHLDATSGLRMHFVDFIQLALLPIILFGVVLDTQGFDAWVIPSALMVGVVFDAFQHANIHFPIEKPLAKQWHKVLNNPHFHIWHHTSMGAEIDGNYSNTLIIWDRIFGTDVTEAHCPEKLGLGEGQLKNNPLDLQLLKLR